MEPCEGEGQLHSQSHLLCVCSLSQLLSLVHSFKDTHNVCLSSSMMVRPGLVGCMLASHAPCVVFFCVFVFFVTWCRGLNCSIKVHGLSSARVSVVCDFDEGLISDLISETLLSFVPFLNCLWYIREEGCMFTFPPKKSSSENVFLFSMVKC